MSIKNFDISYGFNGEPSTASLSFVYKKKTCGNFELQPSIGTFGGSARTGNSTIDSLLSNFVIREINELKEAGFKTISYEMVDKQAKRLESIAVLVRGITAPPIGSSLDDFRRIFNSAEMGLGIGEFGATGIKKHGNKIAVIGRTFSVISASYEDQSASLFYHGGTLVHQAPLGQLSPELITELNNAASNAGIQYGYYLSDLLELISSYGYGVTGYPSDSNFILLDTGGSLKDCISAVASMFGKYWMCRGNQITFFDSSALLAKTVPNFNNYTDPNILSSSYSKDILGRSSVGVIVGTSDSDSNSGTNSFDDKSITINFYLVNMEELFKKSIPWIQAFFSFFKFNGGESFFDKFVFISMAKYKTSKKFMDLLDRVYPEGYIDEDPDDIKLTGLVLDSSSQTRLKEKIPFLDTYTNIYSLQSAASGKTIRLPSQSPLLGFVRSACEVFASLYVSKPVSRSVSRRYQVNAAEGMSVYGPYQGSEQIKDVKELSAMYEIISTLNNKDELDFSIYDLYKKANPAQNTSGQATNATPVLNPETAYYYIGVRDALEMEVKPATIITAEKAVEDVCKDGSGGVVNLDGETTCFATSETEVSKLGTMFSTSQSLVNELSNVQEQIKTKATEIKEEGTDVEDQDLSIYNSEYKSFKVRDSSGSDLSAVSVIKFDGTIGEAAYNDSQFSRLVGPVFFPETSSVTYAGLNLPSPSVSLDPLLESVSVSFSGGVIETSITYSNKEFAAESDNVIMAGYSVGSSFDTRRQLSTRQRNFLGVR